MNKFYKGMFTCLIMFLFAFAPVFAQETKTNPQPAANKKSIEIIKFDVQKGVRFPATLVDILMLEVVDELMDVTKFSQVKYELPKSGGAKIEKPEEKAETETAENESKTEESQTELVLTGTITKFRRTNNTLRLFGGGRAKVVGSIKIIDRATGKVLLARYVTGEHYLNLFEAGTEGTIRLFAEHVAETIQAELKN